MRLQNEKINAKLETYHHVEIQKSQQLSHM